MKTPKRIFSIILAIMLLISVLPSAYALDRDPAENSVAGFGKFEADDIVRAIVIFDGAPAADSGARGSSRALSRAEALEAQQMKFQEKLEDQGVDFSVNFSYTTLLNGISISVPYKELKDIEKMKGVASVHISNTYKLPDAIDEPLTESANEMTGAEQCHAAGYDGKGTVVAILDTGLNTTHAAFQDYGNVEKVVTKRTALNTHTLGQYISAKIPFAYDYADNDSDVTDMQGHGTHVAGIAGGYAEESDGAVSFSGAAPAAQLLILKIFADDSNGTSSDVYFAALEDAYLLGADVINMSLGSVSGFSYDYSLETEYGNIYERLERAGMTVCVAAGNDYSMGTFSRNALGNSVLADYADYGLVSTPSSFVSNTSIASAENAYYPAFFFELDGQRCTYSDNSSGTSFHAKFSGQSVPYVMVPGNGDIADYSGLNVSGKIAVVSRGGIDFSDKLLYAAQKGAEALIVYNNTGGTISMSIDEYPIPAIAVTQEVGRLLQGAGDNLISVPAKGEITDNPDAGYMSDFSSWGPTPDLRLKPTLTAVGGHVYSASHSSDTGYVIKSGTSMATPNAAGCYAVLIQAVRQANPSLSKTEAADIVQSSMLSTAQLIDDGSALYSPRKQGVGLIDVINAAESKAYITEPVNELGDDPEKLGVYSFDITVRRTDVCSDHDYEIKVIKEASCNENGLAEYTCSRCGSSYTEVIAAVGHDYKISSEVAATHTVDGHRTLTCLRCGDSRTEILKANGCPSEKFSDLDASAWYHEGVDYALNMGLFNGVTETNFQPNSPITRAQFAAVLYRLAGSPDVSGLTEPFTDIPDDYWCRNAIIWAYNEGVTTGYTQTSFAPTMHINRGQLVTMLYRYAGSPSASGSLGFKDASSVAKPFVSAVIWAVENGIVMGFNNNTFAPHATASRAQAAVFFARFSEYYSSTATGNQQPAEAALRAEVKDSSVAVSSITYKIEPKVLVDVAEEYPSGVYNTMTSKYADVDFTASCGGKLLKDNMLTFEAGESEKTVTVTIKLTDKTRSYIDKNFKSGAFVDGFVTLSPTDGSGDIHSTFIAFYGDWTKGSILEPYDFRDMTRALYTIRQKHESGLPDTGNIYTVNNMDIDYNIAYIGSFSTYHAVGQNPYFFNEYSASCDTLSTNHETTTNYALYVYPAQLRNARHLVMTVTDSKTGELYYYQDSEYVGKAYYYDSTYQWQPKGMLAWFGTDLGDSPLKDGTEVTVSIYASLDYGEDILGSIPAKKLAADGGRFLEWSFEIIIDSVAPEIESYSYDAETKLLTVSVSDNRSLAWVGVMDAESDVLYDAAECYGTEGTYTIDLSEYPLDVFRLRVEDYASNKQTIPIDLGDAAA